MWLVVAAGLAVAYLGLVTRPESLARSAVKTGAVLALAAWAWPGPGLLVAALVLCAAGDWSLSRPGQSAFIVGVGCFAAGHLVYAGLFLTQSGVALAHWAQWPQAGVATGLGALGVWMAWRLAPRAGALRGAVLGYIPVILLMGLAALTLPAEAGALHPAAWAALLFILSDVILAHEKFVWTPGQGAAQAAPWLIWIFYWGSQVLMVRAVGMV